MMVIRVGLKIQPEHKQTFLDHVKETTAISRKFDGCQRFAVYKDVLEDNCYLLYEEWDSLENFDAYRNSEHFKHSGEILFPLFDGEPDSSYFKATVVE